MLLQVYLGFSLVGRMMGGGLNTTALYAMGRERTPLIIRLVSGGLNVVLDLVLIAWLGPLGAVLATGVAVVITGLIETVVTMRATGAIYPWAFASKVVLAALVAVGVSYPLTGGGWIGLLVGGSVTGIAAAAALALLRPFGSEERSLVVRVMPRLAPVLRFF
ncbi:MAG: hypothetical protein NVSMB42_26570 [Herpetosiphon sp.]